MLRNATAPSRGGLGKEGEPYAMPRAPLLGGLSPQATGGLRRKLLLKSNPNEPPSVHTIPEGVLVILISIVAFVAIVAENAVLSTIATISTIIMS